MVVDSQNMKEVLKNFPRQVIEGIDIGKRITLRKFEYENIIFCGMGGSAIGGDIMANLVRSLPVYVLRSYNIPRWIGKETLAFLISYSGNTEETLSAYEELVERGANIIRITSGGLLEAREEGVLVKIPGGLQPRCAIGYLFFPPFIILQKLGIVDEDLEELNEKINNQANDLQNEDSLSHRLAYKLINKLPIIYTSSPLEAVARRWQTQFNENSKVLSHINLFPELNHNEIVGFGSPTIDNLLIILRDRSFSSKINKRIELTKELLTPFTSGIEEVWSPGDSLLTRIFSLIYLGDWTSYYLALMRGVDPTLVERIRDLKRRLKE